MIDDRVADAHQRWWSLLVLGDRLLRGLRENGGSRGIEDARDPNYCAQNECSLPPAWDPAGRKVFGFVEQFDETGGGNPGQQSE